MKDGKEIGLIGDPGKDGKDGRNGIDGKDGRDCKDMGKKNWKECAWNNLSDGKDNGVVKVSEKIS